MEKRTRIVSGTTRCMLPNLKGHGNGNDLCPINVMCVYQDAQTHEAAGRAGRATINGTPVGRRSWWNLEAFDQPGVLAGAAYMAMRADVIVVAHSCREGLSLPFYIWANSWLPYRQVPGGTLIAVLDEQEADEWVVEHTMEYLRQLAAHANMKFVVERPQASFQRETATENSTRRHHTVLCSSSAEPVLV